jgi:adenylate cyclase
VDKFIGDCIMAFWGAPVPDPEQAKHAVAAAIEMGRVVEDFRKDLGDLSTTFDIGVGVHTGQAVVGFMGAETKLDYTAIGDTVNLASRIEGQTKGVARILVSAATRAACGEAFDFTQRGTYKVKGREQPVELFEPKEKA